MKKEENKIEPLRGEKLAKAAVNQILKNPKTWQQTQWHSPCGTKHCFAGWCQILSGNQVSDAKAMSDAKTALGISDDEATYLFRSNCTLSELYYFVEHFSEEGYNRAGYDREGYNRAGYNREGYDRAGYNRAGYDREGYNRAGYNRAGYNREGYDRAGKQLVPFEIWTP